jgi:hypothetical protein
MESEKENVQHALTVLSKHTTQQQQQLKVVQQTVMDSVGTWIQQQILSDDCQMDSIAGSHHPFVLPPIHPIPSCCHLSIPSLCVAI